MDQDLIDLLAAWKGKELEEARLDQLAARFRQDEALQQAFVDEIRMLGMLKVVQSTEPRWLKLQDAMGWGTGERAGEEELEDAFMRRVQDLLPRRISLRAWGTLAAAAALLLVVGGLIARPWARPKGGQVAVPVAPAPDPDVRPGGIAVVARLEAARWRSADRPQLKEGTVLAPGRFRLDAGRATLSFFSGVSLVLEGPADVDLISSDRVFCRRGRLRARVPKGAEGFVVDSPSSAVVDLGTEFALNVEADGRARVMVFEGMAEAALLDPSGAPRRTQYVEKSEEYELDPRTGRIAETVARPEGFVTAPDLAIPPLVLDPSYADAVTRSRPRGYWRFASLDGGMVPNEVSGGPPLRASGPVAISGASRGNGCALFAAGHPEQFLSSDEPWELARVPGHAVELWFLADAYSYASLVGLYPPRELIPPDQDSRFVHTFLVELTSQQRRSLHKPASIRFMHRWPLDIKVGDNAYPEGIYIPRRWHHLVAQKNGDRMELYLDGEPARSLTLEHDHPSLSCHLIVGRRTPDSQDPKDSRPFVGRLDELAIYDHPLSAEEILHHFRLATRGSPSK